jgi:hypothetical protein
MRVHGETGSSRLKIAHMGEGGLVSGIDIFLSYARRDRATARIIAESLTAEGFSVWWDASLHSGETFDEVIERNLKEATAVVVLWSPASVASRWVRAEATLADRRNKLVPAIIEPCDRPIIFELTHTAELAGWGGDRSESRWRLFVEDLNRLMEADGGRRAVKPAPTTNRTKQAEEVEERPTAAAGSARQMLRPGSNQVIFSDRLLRDAPRANTSVAKPLASVPPPGSEVHCLEIEAGELPEDVIVIGTAGAKIGRTRPADVVLPHRSISREHCIIGVANDELLVTDLNSTNGTFIDDVRIDRATILPVGSTLRVGEISMRHAVQSDGHADGGGQMRRSGGRGSGHLGRFAAAS